jgi:hypothetical protein
MRLKPSLLLSFIAVLVTGCASFEPSSTDKIQTAQQAIQIAKATCDVGGTEGWWAATWQSGVWTVSYVDRSSEPMMQVQIASSDGKAGQCGWFEI